MNPDNHRYEHHQGKIVDWLAKAASIIIIVVTSTWVSHSVAIARVPNKISLPCKAEANKGIHTLCSNKKLKYYAMMQLIFLKRRFPVSYDTLYDALMRATKYCNIDEVCQLETYHHVVEGLGVTEPFWYSDYLSQLSRRMSNTDLTSISQESIGEAESDKVDGAEGEALSGSTITNLLRLDTIFAKSYSVVTAKDSEIYCRTYKLREMKMNDSNASLLDCINSEQKIYEGKTFTTDVNCLDMKVFYYGHLWKVTGYQSSNIMWCNDEEYIVEPNASSYYIDHRLRTLCPNTFSRIRAYMKWTYPSGHDHRVPVSCSNK